MARCGTCDAELDDDARFCEACGAPVDGAAAPPTRARKTVTVLFADLAGSTAMQERMDPESVHAFSLAYYAAMREAIEAVGGRVVKFQGDGVMAVFGVPEVAEDDAIRALRAATAVVDACAALAEEVRTSRGIDLGIRVGVNTGEVVVDESDLDVVGDAVNVAARLEHAAPAGGILVGEGTYRLTRSAASFAEPQELVVHGRREPVQARQLRAIAGGAAAADDPGAFVGREAELESLLDALSSCVATSRPQVVTVLGSPGVGKSRLLRELAAAADPALVLASRCDPASTDTFAPVAEIVRSITSPGAPALDAPDWERVSAAIAFLLGDGDAGTPEQTFWGVRRAIEAAAASRPVLVVLDDAHWAEPLLLDLVEHLVEWLADVPALLVVAARPELREVRPSLLELATRPSKVLMLEGLPADATERLAADLLGGGIPGDIASRIVRATEGNPLFVRELVRMLVDDGVLTLDGDRWVVTVDAARIEVPPTIASLLAARLERLSVDERTVLERASVIGPDVVRGALHELLPQSGRARFDVVLEALRRKELLEPAGTYWIDEPVLRFHHVLIREAAYRRLLKETRAELHARAARWLAAKTGDAPEHDELIGYQLEHAQANRRELGPLDEEGRAMAEEASARLARAARRALHRDDLPAAASLAERAIGCLAVGEPARTELLLVHCEALLGAGDLVAARTSVAELAAQAGGDLRLEAWAAAFTVQVATLTGTADLAAAEREALAAAERLTTLGDPTGAAKALRVRAAVLARQGRVAETEEALDRALTAAREAGDRRQISGVLAGAPLAALWGPSPVPRAGGRCLDVVRLLRITTGARVVEAISARCQAVLEAFRGRTDAARKMLRSARRMLEDLGLRHELLALELHAGIVELTAGEPLVAEGHLRAAHEGFLALGIEVDAGQAAALRARASLALGDIDRAMALAEEADRLGGRDLKTAIAWRSVEAEVLAQRGEHAEAAALARAAVRLAAPTDALVDHADALASLASVLALAGDAAGASAANAQARALYEQKGATALAARLPPAIADPEADLRPEAVHGERRLDAPPPDDNAAVAAHRWSGLLTIAGDWDALRAMGAPSAVVIDRRPGFAASMTREEQVHNLQALLSIGVDSITSDVLATHGDRLALARTGFSGGSGADEVGVTVLVVVELDHRDLIARLVVFDQDDLDGAVEELDHRQIGIDDRNEAVYLLEWMAERGLAGDWDAVRDRLAEAMELDDRRSGGGGAFGGATVVSGLEAAVGFGVGRVVVEPLEAVGEGGAVVRLSFHGADVDYVNSMLVALVVRDGRLAEAATFAEDDLGAARSALGAMVGRDGAQEDLAAWHLAQGRRLAELSLAGAWDEVAEMVAPDVSIADRRPGIGWEAEGRDSFLEAQRGIVAIGVTTIDNEVLAVRGRDGALFASTFASSGGDLSLSTLFVVALDEQGRIRRSTIFDPSQLDAARVELDAVAPSSNRASQGHPAALAAIGEGDVEHLRRTAGDGFRFRDHRSMAGTELDLEAWLASLVPLRDIGVTAIRSDVVAVRGDHLALMRSTYVGESTDYSLSVLSLIEVDEDGRYVSVDMYDDDAVEEAIAALDARPA